MFARILKIGHLLRPLGPGSPRTGNFNKFGTANAGSDFRRKILMHRCMNTGMKELDIILGHFVKENPEVLETAADELESLLEMDTCSIYDLVLGKRDQDNGLAKRIREFATSKNTKLH